MGIDSTAAYHIDKRRGASERQTTAPLRLSDTAAQWSDRWGNPGIRRGRRRLRFLGSRRDWAAIMALKPIRHA